MVPTRLATLFMLVCLAVVSGCPHRSADGVPVPDGSHLVAIIPGCPSREDGHLSGCQWRRAVWGVHLYEAGIAREFVTSGNAAHTPFVEADALAAGMVALGVPDGAILRERAALHTDQNVAYSLRLLAAEGRPAGAVLMASDRGQAKGMCAMVKAWRRTFHAWDPCLASAIDDALVAERMAAGLPDVVTARVEEWVPLAEREAEIAKRTGRRRPPSFWVYARNAMLSPIGRSRPPD